MTIYPLAAVRTLALHTQGLLHNTTPTPDPQSIASLLDQLGAVQIDTLQMVQRSHYLALWSRLGKYDPGDFDRMIYTNEQRRLFEGWMHAACILPLRDYRFQMPHQRKAREVGSSWFRGWIEQPGNAELLTMVRQRILQEGAVRTQDFEYSGPRRDSWWDWKPAKLALEYLFTFGELMIAGRDNFKRIYDMTERVLPAWVDRTEPSPEGRDRYWVELGVRALGACKPNQAGDYSYRGQTSNKQAVRSLLEAGVLQLIQSRLADGEVQELLVHRDNLEALQQSADGALQARRTTFLSPFDSLFWARGRDQLFWNFRQVLEAYKPRSQQIWGYFCLPILHQDRLVGRFDPKLERKNGLLRLKALYLEPEIEPADELVLAVAQAMRDFLAFHSASELTIECSEPAEFGRKLLAAMA